MNNQDIIIDITEDRQIKEVDDNDYDEFDKLTFSEIMTRIIIEEGEKIINYALEKIMTWN